MRSPRRPLALLLAALLASACSDDGIRNPTPDSGLPDAGDVSDADAADDDDADVTVDLGEDAAVLEACLAGQTTTLSAVSGAELVFDFGANRRVAVEVPAGAVNADQPLGLRCLDEQIADAEAVTVSQAVEVEFSGRLAKYATIEIPIDTAALPEGAGTSSIQLYFRPLGATRVVRPPGIDMQENASIGFVRFETRDAGTYQLATPADAGESYDREWQFRAITGVSMGCSGASMIGLRNPEHFDIIGALGGPTDWTYLTHYIDQGGFGGFAPAPEYGSAPTFTPTEEFEHAMAFDDFFSPTGEGSGGTFDRGEYLSILQDLALAFGNTAIYNDESPFLAPGVPADEVSRAIAERCPGSAETVLTIETGFYDDEYNPDGTMPVIMFCDGRSNRLLGCDVAPDGAPCDPDIVFDRYCDLNSDDEPDGPNEGWYPGPDSQTDPVLIAWAVDVDGDGQRDRGEPVIHNPFEPYDDVGTDGLASEDEPDFDAILNPDPNGDDYDWFLNPDGSEGNWLFDEGEPYDDIGLDGVPGTPQLDEGGYDFGEANDRFDYNPNLEALLEERDPHHTVHSLTAEDWDHLTLYLDGGIRDLFNFAVSTNHLAGQIQAAGENIRIYDGFHALSNLDAAAGDIYRFNEVDYPNVGDHVYLRYGDPNASEESVCAGDGKHVGPPGQIANRLFTMLGFIEARFPDGEYTDLGDSFPQPAGDYRFWSEALGAWEQYSIILPSGHELTACSDNEDNDGDDLEDGEDPGCEHGMDNDEGEGLGEPFCNDGIDNDRDNLTDTADPDCATTEDTSEWPADHPMRDAEYPVVYLLHGYGQTPDDLRAAVLPFAVFMGSGIWQKFMVVYPDGFCGDNDLRQCNDGEDNDGDELVDGEDTGCADSGGRGEDGTAYRLCEDSVDNDNDGLVDDVDGGCVSATWDDESDCVKGTFYTNHVAWPDGSAPGPPFEDAMFDLFDHVDDTYRTRAPETFPATR